MTLTSDEMKALSAQSVVRLVFGREVGHLLKYDPVARLGIDEEGVHQLRVGARRLRSELIILQPALKNRAGQALQRELHWIGGVLGRRRDLDVLRHLLVSSKDGPRLDEESPVVKRIDARRDREHDRVGSALNSKRYRHLILRLTHAIIEPPVRSSASGRAIDLFSPGLDEVLDTLFSAVDDLPFAPSSGDLHQLRIMTKRARYTAEIASLFLGQPAEELGSTLSEAQGVLGDLHDRFVAIEFINHTVSSSNLGEHPPSEAQSENNAISVLNASISDMREQWRDPLERARRCRDTL